MSSQNVLDRSWNQKILLLESQFFTCICWIVRIQNACDVLSSLPGLQSIVVLSSIESKEVELIKGQWFPQSQSDCVESCITRNGSIISSGNDSFTVLPIRSLNSFVIYSFSYLAVEMNLVFNVDTLDFPRISVTQPIIWNLNLKTVFDNLLKDSVVISDTISPSRIVKRCERIQEAGCQSSQTSISQGCIDLFLINAFQVVP